MKKVLKLLALFSAIAMLTGCPELNPKEESLQEKINSAADSIDLAGELATENITVTKAITIKNLDMNGKTLTVKKDGVILDSISNATIVAGAEIGDGDLTVKNCTDVKELKVEGGGKNSIHIDGTTVAVITIKKDEVRIILENKTEVQEVTVKADNIKLETTAATTESIPVVAKLNIEPEVKKIELAVEKIEKITVIAEAETKAPEILVTKAIEVTEIEKIVDNEIVEEPVKISIDETVKAEDISLPEDNVKTEIITVEKITFGSDGAKTLYNINEKLDSSNLFALIIYSNGNTKQIPLSDENIENFDSSKAGTFALKIVYEGNEIGTLNIIVSEPVTDTSKADKAAELIKEGFEWLAKMTDEEPHIDEAILCFKAAYEINPCDETKLYYALAELASLSTDESVAKLFKENLGLINYPSSPNALLREDWFVDYKRVKEAEIYKLDTESSYKYFVRVDGTPVEYPESRIKISYILDDEGDWIQSDYFDNDYIKDITPSKDGKYLISTYEIDDYYNNAEAYADYLVSVTSTYNYKYIVTGTEIGPALKVPEFLNESSNFKNSLYNSTVTAESISLLLLGNIIDCNSNGLNGVIDNILGIFNAKYNNAKELIESLSDDAIKLPEELLKGLNLSELFKEDLTKEQKAQLEEAESQLKDLSIGKQELNILISAFEILKGTFQYISSYDFSINTDYLKSSFDLLYVYIEQGDLKPFYNNNTYNLIVPTILSVRNENAVTEAKNTYISALNTIIASYEYLTGEKSPYPEFFKDMLTSFGSTYLEGTKLLVSAIKDGGKFYIPKELSPNTKWPVSDKDESFTSIDMGLLFTPGILSDCIERDADGNVQIYGDIHTCTYEYVEKSLCPEIKPIENYKFKSLGSITDEIEELLLDTLTSFNDTIVRNFGVTLKVNINTEKISKICGLVPVIKEEYILNDGYWCFYNPLFAPTEGSWYCVEIEKELLQEQYKANADFAELRIASTQASIDYIFYYNKKDLSKADDLYLTVDATADGSSITWTTIVPETKPSAKNDDKLQVYLFFTSNAEAVKEGMTVNFISGIKHDNKYWYPDAEYIYTSYSKKVGSKYLWTPTCLSPYYKSEPLPLTKITE